MQHGSYKVVELKRVGKMLRSIPVGSTSLEILIASDVAMSWLAGVMARIMQFGCNEEPKFLTKGIEFSLWSYLLLKILTYNGHM